jgi:H+/Cl- antiporter ClcA
MSNGSKAPETADKSLGEIVSEVSEKASLLVREEIELAKAEIKEKVSSLGRAAGVGVAAGVFLIFALVMLLQALAWFINDLLDVETAIWAGFAIVTGLLVLFAALSGWLALRWIKKGSPPTPDLAIEEAKRTREQFEQQAIERDQVERTLEKGAA